MVKTANLLWDSHDISPGSPPHLTSQMDLVLSLGPVPGRDFRIPGTMRAGIQFLSTEFSILERKLHRIGPALRLIRRVELADSRTKAMRILRYVIEEGAKISQITPGSAHNDRCPPRAEAYTQYRRAPLSASHVRTARVKMQR